MIVQALPLYLSEKQRKLVLDVLRQEIPRRWPIKWPMFFGRTDFTGDLYALERVIEALEKIESREPTLADRREMEDPIMKHFTYEHLPEKLQAVSRPFCDLAGIIASSLPRCAERTVALRKLLESKDAAVRAALEAT